MPDSVKERIEEQVRLALVTALSLADKDVQRQDDKNEPTADDDGAMPDVWVLLSVGDEDVLPQEDEDAALGMETMTLPLTIDVHLVKGKPAGKTLVQWCNQYVALVKQALMTDPHRTETGSSAQLALDTHIAGTFGPLYDDDRRETLCGVDAEIMYRHPEADPYTVG